MAESVGSITFTYDAFKRFITIARAEALEEFVLPYDPTGKFFNQDMGTTIRVDERQNIVDAARKRAAEYRTEAVTYGDK